MDILKKVFTYLILPVAIIALVYAIVTSIQKPVKFNKATEARRTVAIQRLKDIRTLEVAYKSVNGRFTADIDSLAMFYNNGKMDVIMQIGSNDDSLAVANTEKIKKANRKITNEDLYKMWKNGEKNLVFSTRTSVPVKDTLFASRRDFCMDSLRYIPFSGKEPIEMEAVVKQVSGVNVPLFEARMPYKKLLKGLDNQLRINLDAEQDAKGMYKGLQVGSVTTPNNNAGNWE